MRLWMAGPEPHLFLFGIVFATDLHGSTRITPTLMQTKEPFVKNPFAQPPQLLHNSFGKLALHSLVLR
jgi:hypothetical protein